MYPCMYALYVCLSVQGQTQGSRGHQEQLEHSPGICSQLPFINTFSNIFPPPSNQMHVPLSPYCNSLLYGPPTIHITKLQRVQNGAARLV